MRSVVLKPRIARLDAHSQRIPQGMRRFVRACAGVILALAIVVGVTPLRGHADAPLTPQRVLIVHAYHKGFSWTDNLMRGVEDGLSQVRDLHIEQKVEYLDTKAHPLPTIAPQLKSLFSAKYASFRPDVIITSDDNALDFMLDNSETLFANIPVVFCGVNVFSDTRLKALRNFTGVLEDYDIKGTLALMRKFHPKMTNLVIVSDSTETGGNNLRRFWKESAGLLEGVHVRELSNMTSSELETALKTLPADAVILNLSFFRDRDGRSYSPKEGNAFIAVASNRPIYSCWDFYMEGDVIGGHVVSGYAQGFEAAAMAVEILRGRPVSSLPVRKDSPNQYMFDYGPLTRAGFSKADLPEGSVLLREPDTLYSRYKRELVLVACAALIVLVMLVIMALNILHRRRMQAQLSDLLSEYRTIFDNSQVGILHLKAGRTIFKANKRAAAIFGFSEEEELEGRDVLSFHTSVQAYEDFGAKHYLTLARSRRLHIEWTLKRSNGEHFPALLSGKAVDERVPADLSKGVIWIVEDISERKQAEEALRESEMRYRSVVDNIQDIFYRTDANGLLSMVSPSGVRLLGYEGLDEMLGRHNESFWHDPSARQVFLERIRAFGSVRDFEVTLKRKDGSPLVVSTTSGYYRDSQGSVLGVEGIFRDITDRKRAEEQLRQSEEKYRQLVEHQTDLVVQVDTQGRFLYVSPAYCRTFGKSEEELIGTTFMPLVHEDDLSATQEAMKALYAPPHTAAMEQRAMTVDGWRWFAWRDSAILAEDGTVSQIVGVGRDITERKRAEHSLDESRRMLRDVIDTIPVRIFWKDRGGFYMGCNKLFAQDAGKADPESIIGDDDYGMVWADQAALFRADDIEIINTGAPKINFEETLRTQHGGTILLRSSKVPLRNNEGHIYGVLGVYDDITETRKMQEMMVQTEKMISIGGIAAGIAHEINNPLGIITQNAYNLLQRTRPDFKKNVDTAQSIGLDMALLDAYMQRRGIPGFVQDIQDAALRAANIIRHMLDFSRRSDVRNTTCSVTDVLDRAVALAQSDYDLKKHFDFRKIRIVKEYSDNLPLITCAETEIEQVVLNLLRNAAQAMADGPGTDPWIEIKALSAEGSLRVEVADNGPGMPEEVQRRIFEPFFTTKAPGIGTGLGLSVSYFIVTKGHGGRMWVESGPGKGSRFVVELPLHSDAAIGEMTCA